jgi:hypothetical protein
MRRRSAARASGGLFEIALVLKALKGWSPIIKPREEQDQQLDAMRSELEADAPV